MPANALASFKAAVNVLLAAPAKSTSKANQLKAWFKENFSVDARIAQINEDRQIGMRLTEQFDHHLPIVVFVCSKGINLETLEKRIRAKAYAELQAVLVVSVSSGRKLSYEHLYAKTDTPFSDWVERNMNLSRDDFMVQQKDSNNKKTINVNVVQPYDSSEPILAAIRTKPFILLAGISGTGKSRMVRQLARGLCPDESPLSSDPQDPTKKANKPGNFESIPVKPNWHDSTELLGYVTRITEDKKPKFVLTPFVKFLAKAWMNENVPFFLCLDEMNLAPVEQYFAEYLSVIESRDWVDENDHSKGLQTDVMVHFDVAQSSPGEGAAATTENFVKETVAALLEKELASADTAVKAKAEALQAAWVKDGGIRIPAHLVVMGTVNMDETTCSFSRKVLDRAMSFELNDVSDMYAPDKLVGEGDYEFGSIAVAAAKCSLLTGKEAYDANVAVGGKVLEYLKIINEALEGKKFKIAYRSRNEIMIYCVERTNGGIVGLRQALDEATNLKILSRIEGDDQTFASFDLKDFRKTIVKGLLAIDNPSVQDSDVEDFLKDEAKVMASPCASKLGHMIDELSHGAGVVSYWE